MEAPIKGRHSLSQDQLFVRRHGYQGQRLDEYGRTDDNREMKPQPPCQDHLSFSEGLDPGTSHLQRSDAASSETAHAPKNRSTDDQIFRQRAPGRPHDLSDDYALIVKDQTALGHDLEAHAMAPYKAGPRGPHALEDDCSLAPVRANDRGQAVQEDGPTDFDLAEPRQGSVTGRKARTHLVKTPQTIRED